MAYKYYTVAEICDWYQKNTDNTLPKSLLQYMIDKGIITRLPNQRYSLSEVNSFLLEKEDCEYIKNDNNKHIVKQNRLILFNKFNNVKTEQVEEAQFTITKLNGNRLKLIRK